MIQCSLVYPSRPAVRRGWLKLASRSLSAVVCRGSHILGPLLGVYAIIFTYLATAQLTHERRVKEAERMMTIGLLDAESGQRAYLLTGDSSFLVQYRAGLKALATYESVYKNSLVDARSKKMCTELQALLKMETDEMALTNAIYDKAGAAAAFAVVSERRGLVYADTICQTLREIQKTESERAAPFELWNFRGDIDIHGSGITPALSSL